MAISVETIAKMIDPDAWADAPQPSRRQLEAELANAYELIAALRDEVEWLSAGGGDRLTNPVLIQRADRNLIIVDAATDQRQRQSRSLRIAQDVMDACKKMLGNRNALIVIRGQGKARYLRRKGVF